jgi:ABC-type transporter Mla maintaining outer membrane lipid asymmetry ATPase subunit MlaF
MDRAAVRSTSGPVAADATAAAPAVPVIRLVDVAKRFGRRNVLDGVSLEVRAGSRLGIIGPAAAARA